MIIDYNQSMNDRPILIIDALNCFTRAWAVYPQLNSNGQQMGGTIGFLKTLRKLVNEIQPKQVYICWESGGSTKRRKIFKEYKMGRAPEKLNRFYGSDIPESNENRSFQTAELIGILKHVPVCQLYVPDCEGDDVVAALRGRPQGQRAHALTGAAPPTASAASRAIAAKSPAAMRFGATIQLPPTATTELSAR